MTMTQPIIIGLSGVAGWKVLQNSEAKKKEVLAQSADVTRELGHFRDRIVITNSVDDLVDDYRMLRVALGAHGLQSDIGNRAFIKKILNSDLSDERSFANRLGDKRYKRLAESFDFIGKKIPTKKAKADFVNQLGLEQADKKIQSLAIKIEKLVADATSRGDANAGAANSSVSTPEQSDAQNKYLDRLSLEKLIGNDDFRKVVKGALSVDEDFDSYPKTEQLRQLMRGAKAELGVESYEDMLKPENIGRLVWTYAYNGQREAGEKFEKEPEVEAEIVPDEVATHKKYSSRLVRESNSIWDKFSEIAKPVPSYSDIFEKISADPELKDSLKIVFDLQNDFFDKSADEKNKIISDKTKSEFNLSGIDELISVENLSKYTDKFLANSEKRDIEFVHRATLGNYTDRIENAVLRVRDKMSRILNQNSSDFDKAGAFLFDSELRDFFKDAFDLSADFQGKSKYRKSEELLEVIKNKLNTDDLKELGRPENLEKYLGIFLFKKRFAENQASDDPIEKISNNYIEQEFERRVGLGDETMRLALNAKRELSNFATQDASDRKLWFDVMGNPPLRRVFEAAFGFSPSIGRLDIDRQHQEFVKASKRLFGTDSFKEIGRPENTERLIRQYHARALISVDTSVNRYSAALMLFNTQV